MNFGGTVKFMYVCIIYSLDDAFLVGAGAIEFIICHAEVSLAFSEEKKISEVNFLP